MDLSEDVVENLDNQGWMRTDILSLTRELAAETRALRMLHLPDTRTAAQKRRDMEARAASTWSAGAASSLAPGGTLERVGSRDNSRALAVGAHAVAGAGSSSVGHQESAGSDDLVAPSSVTPESNGGAGVAIGGAHTAEATRRVIGGDVHASSRAGGHANGEGPGSLSPRCGGAMS